MKGTLLAVVAGLLATVLIAAQAPPRDPYYHQQWGLDRIRGPEAWQRARGSGVLVAVIDSGVDLAHPDLVGAFARRGDGTVLGYDFVDGDDDPTDEHGHGTMVAGIIGARTSNGSGIAAVAPDVRLMPVRVLDESAAGTSSNVDRGIRWAVDNGADIVNLSLEVAREQQGGLPIQPPTASNSAVRYAWDRGVVVVAAAGNDNDDFTDYPEDSPVLLVGASDREDRRAGFSDTGRRDAVVAPGVDIISTWCNPCGRDASHTIGQSEGTSYAAPHVAGTVALLRSIGYDHEDAVDRVRRTARDIGDPGPDSRTGYGRIDAAAAVGVDVASGPSPAASSPSSRPSRTAAGGEPTSPSATRTRAEGPDGADDRGAPGATATSDPVPETGPPPTLAPPDGAATADDAEGPPPQAAPDRGRSDPNRRWVWLAGVLLIGNLVVLGWSVLRGPGGE